MTALLRRMVIMSLVGFVVAMPLLAYADEDNDGDHDQARELYEHGEIKGLAEIIDIVRATVPGDIVGIDLLRINDKWIYRFQIIAKNGRRKFVDVDANAGVFMRNGKSGG